jgi:hypothetical protein
MADFHIIKTNDKKGNVKFSRYRGKYDPDNPSNQYDGGMSKARADKLKSSDNKSDNKRYNNFFSNYKIIDKTTTTAMDKTKSFFENVGGMIMGGAKKGSFLDMKKYGGRVQPRRASSAGDNQ